MSSEALVVNDGQKPESDKHVSGAESDSLHTLLRESDNARNKINTVLTQLEVEGPPPTGGCVRRGFSGQGDESWANWSTAFHMALRNSNKQGAVLLLNQGFDIDFLNAAGRTALHEAVKSSDYGTVEFLLQKGANSMHQSEARWFKDNDGVMRGGPAGLTAFHEAIGIGDTRMLKLLLEKAGSSIPSASALWTLPDIALVDEQPSMLELLLDHGYQLSSALSHGKRTESFNDAQKKNLARFLLEGEDVIPPTECYEIYLDLLAASEAQIAPAVAKIPQSYATLLSKAYHKALRKMADVPDSSYFTEQYCSRCQVFQRGSFTSSKELFELYPNLPLLLESAQQGCDLCKVFADALENSKSKSYTHSSGVMVKTNLRSFSTMATRELHLTCGDIAADLGFFFLEDSVLTSLNSTVTTAEAQENTVKTDNVRFFPAKRWLERCSLHEQCRSESLTHTVLPKRVIDVGHAGQAPSLYVSEGQEGRYCALSYCWGQQLPVRTTKDNYQSCQSGIGCDTLPQTIQDAIVVTQNLGFRYIWIDCICIIQDDKDDWLRETSMMDKIFANAALVISPADAADCAGGCFRPPKYRINRPVPISLQLPRYYKARGEKNCNSLCILPFQANDTTNGFVSRKPGPVDTRGWVLQEQLLAPRILYFSEGMMFWQCLTLCASEADPTAQSHLYRSISSQDRELRKTKRAIAQCNDVLDATAREELYLVWQELVAKYTPRAVTHATDRVVALMGLNTRIGQGLQDESVGGVWTKSYALRSLLWAVDKEHQTVDAKRLAFPSWSWASVSDPTRYHFTSTTDWAWEVSDPIFDIQIEQSHSTISGSIKLTGTIKVFKDLDIGRCRNALLNPFMSHLTDDDMDKSDEKISEELSVVEGFKDYLSDDHDEIWCLVIARQPEQEPPQFGYPAFLGGRPPSIVCLCLKPIDLEKSIFRRFGMCEFWDGETFWEGAKCGMEVSIV